MVQTIKKPLIFIQPPEVIMPTDDDVPCTSRHTQYHSALDRLKEDIQRKRAYNIEHDPEANIRKHKLKCKECFYSGHVGCDKITQAYCFSCGISMSFPSTVTDLFCPECARQLNVCKHCGRPMD